MILLLTLNAPYRLTTVNRLVYGSEPICLYLIAYLFTLVSPF
ncbi:hypothetical protein BOVA604_1720 [Bacteroides ovatus]|jgi:hypothetical protein|nr:hypothetical protein BOVA604_1720 [Bacteroides ovatus]